MLGLLKVPFATSAARRQVVDSVIAVWASPLNFKALIFNECLNSLGFFELRKVGSNTDSKAPARETGEMGQSKEKPPMTATSRGLQNPIW